MTVQKIPDCYHSITPYIVVKDADAAIAFYTKAFGANMHIRLDMPDGALAHGEFKIGNSIIMIGNEDAQMGAQSPETLGGSPVTMHLYVEDSDTVFQSAVNAGATVVQDITDMFWGDRAGKVKDPFGSIHG